LAKKTKAAEAELSDKIINYSLLIIWGLLLLFGLFTIIQPKWLRDLSKPGRKEEAQTYIDYANMYLYQANQKDAKTNFENAILNYKKALSIDSLNSVAIVNMGVAYLFLNELEEARKQFERCIAVDSLSAFFVHSYIGDYYERKGDYYKALEYYLMSAQAHPSPAYAYRKAGLSAINIQKYNDAIVYLLKAIEMEKSFEFYYKFALVNALNTAKSDKDTIEENIIKQMLNVEDFNMVFKKYDMLTFELSYRISKNLGYAHWYLGDAYYYTGDFMNAVINYETAAKYYPDFKSLMDDKMNNALINIKDTN